MSSGKKAFVGCVLLPIVLFASCAGKMYVDRRMYNLPGEVLRSSAPSTQELDTAMQVAEALDRYVQPRFEILRDKDFGAIRIVYRKHAGIVHLKVDTPLEKALIANVNAAKRDYAISLLHCATNPKYPNATGKPKLELLYLNQTPIITDSVYRTNHSASSMAEQSGFHSDAIVNRALSALPDMEKGKEYRTRDTGWTVLMRPVLASKQSCLNCHTTAKQGDTLGVMVYAVRDTRHTAPAKVSLR